MNLLLPLVESTLPNETLILWSKTPQKRGSKLCNLLDFLKNEVEAGERCRLARFTFTNDVSYDFVPTASCNKRAKEK